MKNFREKSIYIWLYLCKTVENASYCLVTKSKSVVAWALCGGTRGGWRRDIITILVVMVMFIVLLVVLDSWVYAYVNTYQILYFKYIEFIAERLHSIKLLKRRNNCEYFWVWISSTINQISPFLNTSTSQVRSSWNL